LEERTPTIAIVSEGCSPEALSEELGKRGVFSWGGNSYALPLTEALDLEPHGVLRVGLLHYNTADEVGRFLNLLPDCIAAVSAKSG
jgi:selenocysteine lyase/cysteine desulfurase